MKNSVCSGNVFNVPLTSTVLSGAVVFLGAIPGVAVTSGVSGDTIAVNCDGAVYTLDKTTGEAWTQGAALYWNSTTSKATTTSSGNTLLGYAFDAQLSAATTGAVRLLRP